MSPAIADIQKKGKIMMLAYDQGFEHGPVADFNDQNYRPQYILDIAEKGGYSCVTMHYSLARKFWQRDYAHIPMIVKLNGKTNLGTKPYSATNATVEEAMSIGAVGVGYTIYIGGEYEAEMIAEFSAIRKQAHAAGLLMFAWMYPFITPPSSNDDEIEADVIAYAARVGAELGADVIKIKYPRQPEALPWIIKNAVGSLPVLSGGAKATDEEFLGRVENFMEAGGAGIAVGRNAWQHEHPVEISRKAADIVFASR